MFKTIKQFFKDIHSLRDMVVRDRTTEIMNAQAETATKMCNPSKYIFKAEWLGDSVIVNCYGGGGGWIVGDLEGYAYDLAEKVLETLQEHDDKKWHIHSEPTYWNDDGEEVDADYEDTERGECQCVQYQLFKD